MELPANKQSKVTLRETLEQVEKTTGHQPGELNLSELPSQVEHIWEWFFDLHQARTFTQFGPSPITYSEIDSWSRLTNNKTTAEETKILRAIDMSYLKAYNEVYQ